jgi:hypothetical protein
LSALADGPSNSFERFGLRLVEIPAERAPESHPPQVRGPDRRVHTALDRSLLVGLMILQLGYLVALAKFVRWTLQWLTGA